MESAIGGAKVLETRCVELAKKYNVNLYLGKTLEKNKKKGTFVMNNPSYFEKMPITNMAVKNVGILSIKGKNKEIIKQLVSAIVQSKINYEMLCLNETNDEFIFSFSANIADINKISEKIKNGSICKDLDISKVDDACKIMLVGLGLSTHTRIASRVFETLLKHNINFSKVSVTEISISLVVDNQNKQKAIDVLAKEFKLWEGRIYEEC